MVADGSEVTAYTASLRGLTIGDGTSYEWESEPDLGLGGYRTSRLEPSDADGVRVAGPDRLPSRFVTFEVEVFDGRGYDDGGTAAVEALVDALRAAWAPVRSGTVTLTLSLAGGDRQLFGRPVGCLPDLSGALFGRARARLTFEATDPRMFSAVESSIVLGLTEGGGLEFPVTFPATFGSGGDSDGVAVNDGTFETDWVAALAGPLTTPRLTVAASGLYVELDGTVPAGSLLVLSSADKAVLLDGSPRPGWLTLRSRWWQLEPLNNTVRFRAASGSGSCTFSWRSARL